MLRPMRLLSNKILNFHALLLRAGAFALLASLTGAGATPVLFAGQNNERATLVQREMFESSLVSAQSVLQLMGQSNQQAVPSARRFGT